MSYQEEDWRGCVPPSLFWYDNDSGHLKRSFYVMQPKCPILRAIPFEILGAGKNNVNSLIGVPSVLTRHTSMLLFDTIVPNFDHV